MKSYKYVFSIILLFSIMISGCGATPQEIAARAAYDRKIELMTQQAIAGDKKIQRDLCVKYYNADHHEGNAQAMRWCLPSAREGNGWAENMVGRLLYYRWLHQEYTYYPEYYQAHVDHKGRYEFAIYWLRRSVQHGYSDSKPLLDEVEAWYQKEYNTPKDDMFAKIAVAAAGVAILGGTSNSLSSADKLRMSTGYVSDVMTDGKGRGIQSAAQDIRNEKANTNTRLTTANNTNVLANKAKAEATEKEKLVAEQKKEHDATRKREIEEKEKADKEAKLKAEGRIAENSYEGTDLEADQAKTWCSRSLPKLYAEFTSGPNKLLTVGDCSCKANGAVSMQKLFDCKIPYTYREFINNRK